MIHRLTCWFAWLLVFLVPTPGAARWIWEIPPHLVRMDSGKRNSVFYEGEPVRFRLSGTGALSYDVRDYWGNIVAQGSAAANAIAPNINRPGWYKLYLHGETHAPPWGDSVGGAIFAILRRDPHFPTLPSSSVSGGPNPLLDLVMRGVAAIGPERHAVRDVNNPAAAIAQLEVEIALDKKWYPNADPIRPRPLLIAFPNGTRQNLDGVRKIVAHFKKDVTYWEPRNEPNDIPGSRFAVEEMQPFYEIVKREAPSAKVLGPGVVSLAQTEWLEQFLDAGGGKSIDAFSFHAYNNVNGDIALTQRSLDALNAMLSRHGLHDIEKWQTEQGYFAATYGLYQPRLQGRWTMVQMMVYEQYGIPKEHNNLWYDRSGGFWDFPAWWSNEDGSLNPAAVLMRVWSEELYGTRFASALDFGTPGNRLYIGSRFAGSGRQVYALMSAGDTEGRLEIHVPGVRSVRVVSAFGETTDLPVTNGKATVAVPELPVYIETGAPLSIVPIDYGENLARAAGVEISAGSSSESHPPNPDDLRQLVNGTLESPYDACGDVFRLESSTFPAWVDIAFPAHITIDRVIIYAAVPWCREGSLLDYDLQYQNAAGEWITIQTVREPAKSFPAYTPVNRTSVDSFYSDRCIFQHAFPEVTTRKLRLSIRKATWGGTPTREALSAGGHGGPPLLTLREIEVYRSNASAKHALPHN